MFQIATSVLQIVKTKTILLVAKSNLYNKTQNKWKGDLDRVRIDICLGDGWMIGRGRRPMDS